MTLGKSIQVSARVRRRTMCDFDPTIEWERAATAITVQAKGRIRFRRQKGWSLAFSADCSRLSRSTDQADVSAVRWLAPTLITLLESEMNRPRYTSALQRIFALVAILFGLATVVAGLRVLTGSDPGYVVFRPLLIYNAAMGLAYVAAGIIAWRSADQGKYIAGTIFVLNILVLGAIGYLYTTGNAVAIDSIRAMTLRSAVWLVLFLGLAWTSYRNRLHRVRHDVQPISPSDAARWNRATSVSLAVRCAVAKSDLLDRPTKEQVALLPPFTGLGLSQIVVLRSPAQIDDAYRAIEREGFVGFDTESKPTFAKGAQSTGPHVVQFALQDRAFIVQIGQELPLQFLSSVLESDAIVKVGFGLTSDRSALLQKLGVRLGATVELTRTLRGLHYKDALGAKAAVAIVLGQRLQKSRSVTTSNWSSPVLKPNQLLYAANDAYAALAVFRALGSPYTRSEAPTPSPSIEGKCEGPPHVLGPAAHVKRWSFRKALKSRHESHEKLAAQKALFAPIAKREMLNRPRHLV
jgi:hypothetical protein